MAEKTASTPIGVLSAAYTPSGDPYRWGPGVRVCYSLHYVVKGRGVFVCDGTTFELTKDSYFLIFPNSLVSYHPDPDDPWEYTWVDFEGDEAEALLACSSLTRRRPIAAADPSELPYFHTIAKTWIPADPVSLCRCGACLRWILASVIERSPSKKELYRPSVAEQAKADIERSYHDPEYSIGVLTRRLGISRASLHRHFLSAYGISPGEYILRLRIEKARELLLRSRHSVKSVAYSVGFSDPLYFSKLFKRHIGISPLAYRRAYSNPI